MVSSNEFATPILSLLESLRAENRTWRLLTTKRLMSSLAFTPLALHPVLNGNTCKEVTVVEEQKENIKGGARFVLYFQCALICITTCRDDRTDSSRIFVLA